MKKILFFGALLGACLSSYAQSSLKIKYEGREVPDTLFISIDNSVMSDMERIISLEFDNTSSATITSIFSIDPLVVPQGADGFYFCGEWDGAVCTDIGHNISDPKDIAAKSHISYALHYWANDVKETASVRCVIVDANNEENTASVVVCYKNELGVAPIVPVKQEIAVEAYPNPVINTLNIRYSLSKVLPNIQIVVRNMLGSIVKQVPLYEAQGKLNINVEDLSNGIYFYSVVSSGQVLTTKKIIIKR